MVKCNLHVSWSRTDWHGQNENRPNSIWKCAFINYNYIHSPQIHSCTKGLVFSFLSLFLVFPVHAERFISNYTWLSDRMSVHFWNCFKQHTSPHIAWFYTFDRTTDGWKFSDLNSVDGIFCVSFIPSCTPITIKIRYRHRKSGVICRGYDNFLVLLIINWIKKC